MKIIPYEEKVHDSNIKTCNIVICICNILHTSNMFTIEIVQSLMSKGLQNSTKSVLLR